MHNPYQQFGKSDLVLGLIDMAYFSSNQKYLLEYAPIITHTWMKQQEAGDTTMDSP